jgi:hypothetical protein
MPRYSFHVDDGSSPDDDGVEVADIAVAKCEAVKLAGQLVCEAAGEFWGKKDFGVTVANAAGLTLFSLRFVGSEAAAMPCANDAA